MRATIPIDKAGRLVLPKEFRVKLHLEAGDWLDIELAGNEVRLSRRHQARAGLSREGGRVVWDAPGASATIEEIDRALTRGRTERDGRASGL